MKLSKRILNHHLTQSLICGILYVYAQCVRYSSRWTVEGKEYIQELEDSGKPYIMILWHNRLMFAPVFSRKIRKTYAVVSQHTDGEYVARFLQLLKVIPIRGSSKKGAVSAAKECLKVLKDGDVLVITPDGPRGPRMQLGGNVVSFAQKAGVPIISFAYASSRCKIFKSWDRFILPYPFGKGAYIYSKPVSIPKNLDEKALKEATFAVQQQLNDISAHADKLAGNEPIKP